MLLSMLYLQHQFLQYQNEKTFYPIVTSWFVKIDYRIVTFLFATSYFRTVTLLFVTIDSSCLGLLVLGGANTYNNAGRSVEYWSPDATCILPDLSREMYEPSVNFIQDTIVVCYDDSCDKLQEGAWVKMADTLQYRYGHTTEVTSDKILLIGGDNANTTTELVTVNGQSVEGFSLDHVRSRHCSVKISDSTVVIIGGGNTWARVTEYSGIGREVTSRELPDLLTGRQAHACGQFMDGETQVMTLVSHWSLHSLYTVLCCTLLY